MPRVVLVSGSPGAGKSTLAGPLAEELGLPLLCKDHIKETLHDSLDGTRRDLEWSRRLGKASMELMWALAARCPEVVLEANFIARAREPLVAMGADVVEVFCACPPAEASRRYAERYASTHPVHVNATLPVETMASYEPLDLGPVINVDTSRPVDVPEIALEVRRAFRQSLES